MSADRLPPERRLPSASGPLSGFLFGLGDHELDRVAGGDDLAIDRRHKLRRAVETTAAGDVVKLRAVLIDERERAERMLAHSSARLRLLEGAIASLIGGAK